MATNSSPSPCNAALTPERLIRAAAELRGACRTGFAEAGPVDERHVAIYRDWIAAGRHGSMGYLERYDDIRRDPRLLLDGARSIICCAFDYRQPYHNRHIADYALGDDYHTVVRRQLESLAAYIRERFGGETRVCVDTAPIRERYWASRAGLGVIGLHNQLIVPGIGSQVFLGEVLWTGELPPDKSLLDSDCGHCGRCHSACPGGAIDGRGGLDARRCHSYLTIECRDNLDDSVGLGDNIVGCDICQRVCPHNIPVTTPPALFRPRPDVLALTREAIAAMDHESYCTAFRDSAIRRIKHPRLLHLAQKKH